MILYFLRHGLASDRMTWQEDDHIRPLTDKGVERMHQEAKTIAALDLEIDQIISSPLTRAAQTARIVAEHLGRQDDLLIDERLAPGFDPKALESLLNDYPEAKALLLVGHEPDFSETISALVGGGRIVCKKGSLAKVDVDEDTLEGVLEWLVPPGILAADSGRIVSP